MEYSIAKNGQSWHSSARTVQGPNPEGEERTANEKQSPSKTEANTTFASADEYKYELTHERQQQVMSEVLEHGRQMKTKRLPLKRVFLTDDFRYDVVLVGAGHFNAGICLGLKIAFPTISILVVDINDGPGGCWRDANSFSFWITPLPVASNVRLFYLHDITGLPCRQLATRLALRKDYMSELEDLYGWTGAHFAFRTKLMSFQEGRMALSTPTGIVFGTCARCIYPRYRNMNSFHDCTTRFDSMLKMDFLSARGVRILGNSLQAAEAINFIMREKPGVKVQVLYRTPHFCHFPGKPGENMKQYLEHYRSVRGSASPNGPLMMTLYHYSRRKDHLLEFVHVAKVAPTDTDGQDGWIVLDARNNVNDSTDPPDLSRHAHLLRPSLSISTRPGAAFAKEIMASKVSILPVISGFSYAMWIHDGILEPLVDDETKALFESNYHYYQVLGRQSPWLPLLDKCIQIRKQRSGMLVDKLSTKMTALLLKYGHL